jgi:hypothetical protein
MIQDATNRVFQKEKATILKRKPLLDLRRHSRLGAIERALAVLGRSLTIVVQAGVTRLLTERGRAAVTSVCKNAHQFLQPAPAPGVTASARRFYLYSV